MKTTLNNQEKLLHQKFRSIGQDYQSAKYKLLKLLPEIRDKKIPEKLGFSDVYQYAISFAGLSISAVEKSLQLNKKLIEMPKLRQAIEKVGVNKVRIVARVATKETEEFWTDKALNQSKRSLEVAVKEFSTGAKTPPPAKALKINLNFEAQKTFRRLKKKFKLKKIANSNEKTLELLLKKLEELSESKPKIKAKTRSTTKVKAGVRASTISNTKAQGQIRTQSRYINALEKQKVTSRSKGNCEYPHCTNAHGVFHHTKRFAKHHTHKNNIVSLCKIHHELVHNGFIKNEHDDPKNWILQNPCSKNIKLSNIDQKLRLYTNMHKP